MSDLSRRGYTLAAWIHAGQRYGDDPYIAHCNEVHDLIASLYPGDEVLQVAAGLHDAIEDAPTGMDARALIARECGAEVLALVEAVTDEPGSTRAERKANTLPKTAAAGWRAVAIKLADRLSNARGDKLEMYRREYPAFRAALYPVSEDRAELRLLWDTLDRMHRWGRQ